MENGKHKYYQITNQYSPQLLKKNEASGLKPLLHFSFMGYAVSNTDWLFDYIFAVFDGIMIIVRHDLDIFLDEVVVAIEASNINGEIVARGGVAAEHFEWSSSRTLFDLTVYKKTRT